MNPGFEKICDLEADLSGMKNSLIRKQGPDGPFDELEFYITIQLGGTELHARIEWVENVSYGDPEIRYWLALTLDYYDEGTARSGPISIIPEPIDLPPGGRNMN